MNKKHRLTALLTLVIIIAAGTTLLHNTQEPENGEAPPPALELYYLNCSLSPTQTNLSLGLVRNEQLDKTAGIFIDHIMTLETDLSEPAIQEQHPITIQHHNDQTTIPRTNITLHPTNQFNNRFPDYLNNSTIQLTITINSPPLATNPENLKVGILYPHETDSIGRVLACS